MMGPSLGRKLIRQTAGSSYKMSLSFSMRCMNWPKDSPYFYSRAWNCITWVLRSNPKRSWTRFKNCCQPCTRMSSASRTRKASGPRRNLARFMTSIFPSRWTSILLSSPCTAIVQFSNVGRIFCLRGKVSIERGAPIAPMSSRLIALVNGLSSSGIGVIVMVGAGVPA